MSTEKFELGQGIGKHGQGILNPILADLRPAKGGIGTTVQEKPGKKGAPRLDDEHGNVTAATIDMDLHDKAGEKKAEIEAVE